METQIAGALFEKLFFILTYVENPPYAEYRELDCVESEDAFWEYLNYNCGIEEEYITLKNFTYIKLLTLCKKCLTFAEAR